MSVANAYATVDLHWLVSRKHAAQRRLALVVQQRQRGANPKPIVAAKKGLEQRRLVPEENPIHNTWIEVVRKPDIVKMDENAAR